MRPSVSASILFVLLTVSGSSAQDHAQHAAPGDATRSWQWSWDGNVFAGFNYQRRRFTDFDAWESQNWLMLHGERRSGPHTLRLNGMTSFEAFTLQDIGSPQVFQTGETFAGVPLVDYQHPHDLIMGAGITWVRAWDRG